MLVEAWLTIKWKLQSSIGEPPKDEQYPLAVGKFDSLVRPEFPNRISLDSNQVPMEITPHVPRFQFVLEKGEEKHKLLQIGPGIATVNYLSDYNWNDFRNDVYYLVEKLFASYELPLEIQSVTLQYRNAIEFDYNNQDLIEFLDSNFGIKVSLPKDLPGSKVETESPRNANFKLSYNLQAPLNQGNFVIATGHKREEKGKTIPVIVQESEIVSERDNIPDLTDKEQLFTWLDSANEVANKWNFSEK